MHMCLLNLSTSLKELDKQLKEEAIARKQEEQALRKKQQEEMREKERE